MRRSPQPPFPSLFASAPLEGGPVAPPAPPAPSPAVSAISDPVPAAIDPAPPVPAYRLTAELVDDGELPDDDNPFGLTPREQLFVTAYTGVTKFNATKAYGLAGYSTNGVGATVRQNAANLLRKPRVKRAAQARRRALAALLDNAMERDEALKRMSTIARVDPREVWAHEPLIAALPGHVAMCIKSVARTTEGTLRIEIHNSVQALEAIGKWRGMAHEHLDVTLTHRLEDILAASRQLPTIEAVAS